MVLAVQPPKAETQNESCLACDCWSSESPSHSSKWLCFIWVQRCNYNQQLLRQKGTEAWTHFWARGGGRPMIPALRGWSRKIISSRKDHLSVYKRRPCPPPYPPKKTVSSHIASGKEAKPSVHVPGLRRSADTGAITTVLTCRASTTCTPDGPDLQPQAVQFELRG